MYNKTIWNSGDIITQGKWDNINNNLSILGAYQLPVTIENIETTTKIAQILYNITIYKSYNEIINLLKQGIICYFYNNLNGNITYIENYNNTDKTLNNGDFHEENGNMINFTTNSGPIE